MHKKLYYVVPPVVRCNVSETAVLNQSISGSSIAIGSPRPLTRVIMSLHCNYHTKLTVVNNYTTMVEFTIPQVSRYCQDIYCYAANDQTAIVTKQLNFTGNAYPYNFFYKCKPNFPKFNRKPNR